MPMQSFCLGLTVSLTHSLSLSVSERKDLVTTPFDRGKTEEGSSCKSDGVNTSFE